MYICIYVYMLCFRFPNVHRKGGLRTQVEIAYVWRAPRTIDSIKYPCIHFQATTRMYKTQPHHFEDTSAIIHSVLDRFRVSL